MVVPLLVKPTCAAALYGPLIFEGTIHSHLMSTDIWSRIWSEWERHSFARMSEDLGLVLLEAGLVHSGTLTPSVYRHASANWDKTMSKLHGSSEAKLGPGELRKPGDYTDQPGQGVLPPDEGNERDSAEWSMQNREPSPAPDKEDRSVPDPD